MITLAAAAVAGIAALVIPLSLSGGTSTTTSANSERGVAQSDAGAAVAAPVQPPAEAASDLAAPAASGGFAADSGTSVPGGAPAGSGQAPAAGGGDVSAGGVAAASAPCWPTLTGAAAAALVSALPAGAFGAPEPLTGECVGAPVGGASLPGSVPGTVLNVRISTAAEAACVHPDGANAEPCVPQPDGTYLVADGPGTPTVFAYTGGAEVAVGGSPDTGEASGLSPGQLATVAGAVVAALG